MTQQTPDKPVFRTANIDEIYQLRFAVLRPGQAVKMLHFPGDEGQPPLTWHFGAFLPQPESMRNIACLTLFASSYENAPAIQLRGMAVAPECRGHGYGARLLQVAESQVLADPRITSRLWWCNARLNALGFYERIGWRVVSDEFLIEGVGPHRVMIKEL